MDERRGWVGSELRGEQRWGWRAQRKDGALEKEKEKPRVVEEMDSDGPDL
jgi:hypothetical protein